jgi:SlyX protein
MDKRITELEIRLTHNEHTLEILDHSVIEQHKLIDRLQLQVSILEKKLKAVAEASPVARESEETPPPHY